MIVILTTIFLLIAALLLIVLVLLQNPKDEGGHNALGGGMQQMIGVAYVANFLEKITYGLCLLFFVLALSTSFFLKQQADTQTLDSPNLAQANAYAIKKDSTPPAQK